MGNGVSFQRHLGLYFLAPNDTLQKRCPYVHSVLGLFEVFRDREVVKVWVQFVDSRKWMHDIGKFLVFRKHSPIQIVGAFELVVFGWIVESFLLEACHVEKIQVVFYVLKIVNLLDVDLAQAINDLLPDLEFCWRDIIHLYAIEFIQSI